MDDSTIAATLASEHTYHNSLLHFDEEKCRNVLVRCCAHIPRNYRYCDGIRLVFLVLRDHLGDECLGLAGGVLYELIEVDCHHSNDPGAAFQRWRHDHMARHDDLELPHIPHLTTVVSIVKPTAMLVRWRADHPERYQTRLSDFGSLKRNNYLKSSCLKARKDWVIKYTMFVSSQSSGTHPFRRMKAKEFHERHWSEGSVHQGRLVGQKSVALEDISWHSKTAEQASSNPMDVKAKCSLKERIFQKGEVFQGLLQRPCRVKEPSSCPKKMIDSSTLATSHPTSSLYDVLESETSPQVKNWEIPNANFARKFGLYNESGPLPSFFRELPIAEEKAMGVVPSVSIRRRVYSQFSGAIYPSTMVRQWS